MSGAFQHGTRLSGGACTVPQRTDSGALDPDCRIDRLPRGVSAVKQGELLGFAQVPESDGIPVRGCRPGMQCVAERVRDLADGTLEVVHVLGSIACIKRLKLGPFQHCQIVCLSFLTASLHEMLKTCEAIVEGWID